jgi:hypothetical protein
MQKGTAQLICRSTAMPTDHILIDMEGELITLEILKINLDLLIHQPFALCGNDEIIFVPMEKEMYTISEVRTGREIGTYVEERSLIEDIIKASFSKHTTQAFAREILLNRLNTQIDFKNKFSQIKMSYYS